MSKIEFEFKNTSGNVIGTLPGSLVHEIGQRGFEAVKAEKPEALKAEEAEKEANDENQEAGEEPDNIVIFFPSNKPAGEFSPATVLEIATIGLAAVKAEKPEEVGELTEPCWLDESLGDGDPRKVTLGALASPEREEFRTRLAAKYGLRYVPKLASETPQEIVPPDNRGDVNLGDGSDGADDPSTLGPDDNVQDDGGGEDDPSAQERLEQMGDRVEKARARVEQTRSSTTVAPGTASAATGAAVGTAAVRAAAAKEVPSTPPAPSNGPVKQSPPAAPAPTPKITPPPPPTKEDEEKGGLTAWIPWILGVLVGIALLCALIGGMWWVMNHYWWPLAHKPMVEEPQVPLEESLVPIEEPPAQAEEPVVESDPCPVGYITNTPHLFRGEWVIIVPYRGDCGGSALWWKLEGESGAFRIDPSCFPASTVGTRLPESIMCSAREVVPAPPL